MPQPIADTSGGSWNETLKSKRNDLNDAVRQALKDEHKRRHPPDPQGLPAPVKPIPESTFSEYEEWVRRLLDPLMDIPNPEKSRTVASQLSKLVGDSPVVSGSGGKSEPPRAMLDVDEGSTLGDPELSEKNKVLFDEWHGYTASQCKEFLDKIPEAVNFQICLGKVLRDTMTLNAKTMKRSRENTTAAIDKAITALEALHSGGGVTIDVDFLAFAIGATTTLAGVYTGATPAGYFTVMAGVGTIESAFEVKVTSISGDDVDGVLDSLEDKINDILDAIKNDGQAVSRTLKKDLKDLEAGKLRKHFIARRPAVLDQPGKFNDNLDHRYS